MYTQPTRYCSKCGNDIDFFAIYTYINDKIYCGGCSESTLDKIYKTKLMDRLHASRKRGNKR